MKLHELSWNGEVRAHEIDAQGIVNNAHYFCYFDHVRTLQVKALGIDWVDLSKAGFDLVLVHAELSYHRSMRAFQCFQIKSCLEQVGKLKWVFDQQLFDAENQLVCKGLNTVVCLDRQRNKPVSFDKIYTLS